MNDVVDREEQQPRHNDADHTGQHADDEGLGVEDGGNVPLRSADGAQDTDLLGALQNGDVSDDTDHDRGDYQ